MDIKIVLSNAGISETSQEDWARTHITYNRIHMPLEGRALYHDSKEDVVLHEGRAYLMVNSCASNFEKIPDYHYYHMYIDFRTVPPLFCDATVEIDLSKDQVFLYLMKTVQTVLQERKREKRSYAPLQNDERKLLNKLLQAIVVYLEQKYKVTRLENPKVEKAIHYIDEHYSENIRNEDIAAALYIDKRSLIRLFNKYMGMTPCQYLMQCRIEHAVEELRQGKSVTETASLCGYQSEIAFRWAFKRVMGGTPKSILNL